MLTENKENTKSTFYKTKPEMRDVSQVTMTTKEKYYNHPLSCTEQSFHGRSKLPRKVVSQCPENEALLASCRFRQILWQKYQ